MNKPHKHAALIKAWADGAEIEYLYSGSSEWTPISAPSWDGDGEYRIKPEPKPDVVMYLFASTNGVSSSSINRKTADNLKLTFDGQTGRLKTAEINA